MADNKAKIPEEGPNGVDRWTCNGYGLTVNGVKTEPPEENEDQEVDEIEEV